MRPNWIEVSRRALTHNYHTIAGLLQSPSTICAVVKANAYGHGGPECARILEAAGCGWFAVSSAEEGADLRAAGVAGRILVVGGMLPADAPLVVAEQLTPVIWEVEQVRALDAALNHRPDSAFAVHLKLDTGMGRLGAREEDEAGLFAALQAAPGLHLEAVLTHFSAADSSSEWTRIQMGRFETAVTRLRQSGWLDPNVQWHVANSAATQRFPGWSGSFVRVGLALYGYGPEAPSADHPNAPALQPVLSWKTRVISLRTLPEGHPVGYGCDFRTPRISRIATLAVGYADGYMRRFWPGAHVLIRGRCAPVVGRISMDLTTVDVTDLPEVAVQDEVVLLGTQGNECLTAYDLAKWADSIVYEVLCAIAGRVHRTTVG